jgi:hypothetical protein
MIRFNHYLMLLCSLVAINVAVGQESPDDRAKGESPTPVAPSQTAPDKPVTNESVTAEGAAFFEKKIRPVLVTECYGCHSTETGKKVRGGLALDSREGTRQGGVSGPVIVPGKPSQSLLIKALGHGDPELAMPPKKKLDAAIVNDFEEWIRMGAPDPRQETQVARANLDIEKGREHWAYRLPRQTAVPMVKNATWAFTDVDRFILAS